MPGKPHKQQSDKSARAARRDRLAQELRSNLRKRKALARARRSQSGEQAGDTGERSEDDSSEK